MKRLRGNEEGKFNPIMAFIVAMIVLFVVLVALIGVEGLIRLLHLPTNSPSNGMITVNHTPNGQVNQLTWKLTYFVGGRDNPTETYVVDGFGTKSDIKFPIYKGQLIDFIFNAYGVADALITIKIVELDETQTTVVRGVNEYGFVTPYGLNWQTGFGDYFNAEPTTF